MIEVFCRQYWKRNNKIRVINDLCDKSVQAAIEIYNKPDFSYREESFSLLIINSWELLLKAKWLLDHDEDSTALHVYKKDENGEETLKTNRSGNPIIHGITFLAERLLTDVNSGLEKPW